MFINSSAGANNDCASLLLLLVISFANETEYGYSFELRKCYFMFCFVSGVGESKTKVYTVQRV